MNWFRNRVARSSYALFLPPIIDLTNQRHRINCDAAGHRFLAVSTTFLEAMNALRLERVALLEDASLFEAIRSRSREQVN